MCVHIWLPYVHVCTYTHAHAYEFNWSNNVSFKWWLMLPPWLQILLSYCASRLQSRTATDAVLLGIRLVNGRSHFAGAIFVRHTAEWECFWRHLRRHILPNVPQLCGQDIWATDGSREFRISIYIPANVLLVHMHWPGTAPAKAHFTFIYGRWICNGFGYLS